jgi:hypothetical protein
VHRITPIHPLALHQSTILSMYPFFLKAYSLWNTVNMDAAGSPVGLVWPTYQSTWHDIPGDHNYHHFTTKPQYIHKLALSGDLVCTTTVTVETPSIFVLLNLLWLTVSTWLSSKLARWKQY